MTPEPKADVVLIARCPEHGLHGQRDECFVCGGSVEQVEMVPADVLRRVVANEGNHYDRSWTPAPNPLTDEWLDETETKMREALTDVFCDDAAAVMLTLIAEIRRLQVTQGLPADLVEVMRDPSIIVPRDFECRLADGRTLHEHLEEWRNAPSDTASA